MEKQLTKGKSKIYTYTDFIKLCNQVLNIFYIFQMYSNVNQNEIRLINLNFWLHNNSYITLNAPK